MQKETKLAKLLENPNIGHNGGNPNAKLWFCGLENNADDFCEQHNINLINGNNEHINQEWCPFNNFIWKILNNLNYNPSENAEEMYKSNNFFCANLYPFACRSKKDETNIHELTGFTKEQYYNFCDITRHQNKAWQDFYKKSRIIICFGISKIESFIMQFTTSAEEFESAMIQYWQYYTNANINNDGILIKLNNRTLLICHHPSHKKPDIKNIVKHINKIS